MNNRIKITFSNNNFKLSAGDSYKEYYTYDDPNKEIIDYYNDLTADIQKDVLPDKLYKDLNNRNGWTLNRNDSNKQLDDSYKVLTDIDLYPAFKSFYYAYNGSSDSGRKSKSDLINGFKELLLKERLSDIIEHKTLSSFTSFLTTGKNEDIELSSTSISAIRYNEKYIDITNKDVKNLHDYIVSTDIIYNKEEKIVKGYKIPLKGQAPYVPENKIDCRYDFTDNDPLNDHKFKHHSLISHYDNLNENPNIKELYWWPCILTGNFNTNGTFPPKKYVSDLNRAEKIFAVFETPWDYPMKGWKNPIINNGVWLYGPSTINKKTPFTYATYISLERTAMQTEVYDLYIPAYSLGFQAGVEPTVLSLYFDHATSPETSCIISCDDTIDECIMHEWHSVVDFPDKPDDEPLPTANHEIIQPNENAGLILKISGLCPNTYYTAIRYVFLLKPNINKILEKNGIHFTYQYVKSGDCWEHVEMHICVSAVKFTNRFYFDSLKQIDASDHGKLYFPSYIEPKSLPDYRDILYNEREQKEVLFERYSKPFAKSLWLLCDGISEEGETPDTTTYLYKANAILGNADFHFKLNANDFKFAYDQPILDESKKPIINRVWIRVGIASYSTKSTSILKIKIKDAINEDIVRNNPNDTYDRLTDVHAQHANFNDVICTVDLKDTDKCKGAIYTVQNKNNRDNPTYAEIFAEFPIGETDIDVWMNVERSQSGEDDPNVGARTFLTVQFVCVWYDDGDGSEYSTIIISPDKINNLPVYDKNKLNKFELKFKPNINTNIDSNIIEKLPEEFKTIKINKFIETNNEDWFNYKIDPITNNVIITGIKDNHKIIEKRPIMEYNTTPHDVLIWVDTSGSMAEEMQSIKNSVLDLYTTMSNTNSNNRIAFFVANKLAAKNGNVYAASKLTNDKETLTNNINTFLNYDKVINGVHNGVTDKLTNWGEDPTIITQAFNEPYSSIIEWSTNSLTQKILIMIADETETGNGEGAGDAGSWTYLRKQFVKSNFKSLVEENNAKVFFIYSNANLTQNENDITVKNYYKIEDLFKRELPNNSKCFKCNATDTGAFLNQILLETLTDTFDYVYGDNSDDNPHIVRYKEGDPNPPPEFHMTIPYKIEDFYVTSIKDGAFKDNMTIRSFITQPNLKTIGDDIFDNENKDLEFIECRDYKIDNIDNLNSNSFKSIKNNNFEIKLSKTNFPIPIKGLCTNNKNAYLKNKNVLIPTENAEEHIYYPIYSNSNDELWPLFSGNINANGSSNNYVPHWDAIPKYTISFDCSDAPDIGKNKIFNYKVNINEYISINNLLLAHVDDDIMKKSFNELIYELYNNHYTSELYCDETNDSYFINDIIHVTQNITLHPIVKIISISVNAEKINQLPYYNDGIHSINNYSIEVSKGSTL